MQKNELSKEIVNFQEDVEDWRKEEVDAIDKLKKTLY